MKNSFFTGLIIILPITITVWLLSFFISVCTKPFESVTKDFLLRYQLFQSGWWLFSAEHILHGATVVLILLSITAILGIIGWLGRWIVIHYLLRLIDRLVLRIPFVNKIYKACHEFTGVLFSPKSSSFSRVVWTPFPTAQQCAMGLVTNEISLQIEGDSPRAFTSVLLPGTPNPTVGFLILCPSKSLAETPLTVDKAMKWVISCGSSETGAVMESVQSTAVELLDRPSL